MFRNEGEAKMIFTLHEGDNVQISNQEINITTPVSRYQFNADQLMEVSILTTDSGPKVDDTGLVLFMDNDDAFIIMSENPLYRKLIFQDMRELVDIDYSSVLAASFATERGMFERYRYDRCVNQ